jgi:hypothetical protein
MLDRHTLINSLFNKYNLINPVYLEIGVWEGTTFKHINSINKDGVDPGQYCDSDYVNYKMNSDNFFLNNHKKYDFIFIDGLHTAHQVSKDIFNSIKCLNPGGIIMLDDVFPHNKNEQEALNLNKSGAQTGDVWKAVYNVMSELIKMSDDMIFVKDTERGNLIIKFKQNNTNNIIIDDTIPTMNIDGWYTGKDAEWDKYIFDRDYKPYTQILFALKST